MKPWLKNLGSNQAETVHDAEQAQEDEEEEAEEGGGGASGKSYHHCTLSVFKDEMSVKSRMKLVRGIANLKQSETLHILSPSQIYLPDKDCPVYAGQSNKGTIVGPVVLPDPDLDWVETVGTKKVIYKSWRKEIGGKQLAKPNVWTQTWSLYFSGRCRLNIMRPLWAGSLSRMLLT